MKVKEMVLEKTYDFNRIWPRPLIVYYDHCVIVYFRYGI